MAGFGEKKRRWRYVRGLIGPVVLWGLFVGLLIATLQSRLHGDEEYDQAALREWVEESRSFRETLPEMVRHYLDVADPSHGQPDLLPVLTEEIHDHLQALCDPTKMYQGQLPLFPAIYRAGAGVSDGSRPFADADHLGIGHPPAPANQPGPAPGLSLFLAPRTAGRVLHCEYQMHAFNKRQRDEEAANLRLRWVGGLAAAATALAFLWIYLVQAQERGRERQHALAEHQVNQAERLLLEGELRRQEAERRQEEAERNLLEQRLATQAAERQALELKSQLYASIGIMAGSYAHNIKNLLVRPNDLLRRCLEADGLRPDQELHAARGAADAGHGHRAAAADPADRPPRPEPVGAGPPRPQRGDRATSTAPGRTWPATNGS